MLAICADWLIFELAQRRLTQLGQIFGHRGALVVDGTAHDDHVRTHPDDVADVVRVDPTVYLQVGQRGRANGTIDEYGDPVALPLPEAMAQPSSLSGLSRSGR